MVFAALACYVASFITGNDSWVDRTWSVIPVVHAWVLALGRPPGAENRPKQQEGVTAITAPVLFASLITLWGLRLTYNFYRRGGFSRGGEDYRWEEVRTWRVFRSRAVWQLWSFGFISIFQQALLWLIVVPLAALPHAALPTALNCGQAGLFLFFLVFETCADQQQWNFQNEKQRLFPRRPQYAEDYERGFLTHGLFSVSRKPAVWAEQQIWSVIASISFVQAGRITWGILGSVTLIALTIGSCVFTESLSTARYPTFRIYKRHVSMLVPRIFRGRTDLDNAFAAAAKTKKA